MATRWSMYSEHSIVVGESLSLTVTVTDGHYADGRSCNTPQDMLHMRITIYGCGQEIMRMHSARSDSLPELLKALAVYAQNSVAAGRLLAFTWEGVRVL